MLKFINKSKNSWRDIAFAYTLSEIQGKDSSELVSQASEIYFSKNLKIDRSKTNSVIKNLLDTFDKQTTVHLVKYQKALHYVIDSAKPRKGDNLQKVIDDLNPLHLEGRVFDAKVSGISLIKKDKTWIVSFAKIHKVELSNDIADTVRSILAKAQSEGSLLTPSNSIISECKLIKYQKKPTYIIPTTVSSTKVVEFCKSDSDKRLVYGIVYEPDVVDSDGHFSTSDVIEETAHEYMADYQNINLMHEQPLGPDIKVVESYIAPIDFNMGNQYVRKGSWVMVVRILNDELWQAVKEGKLNGFSIEGKGTI